MTVHEGEQVLLEDGDAQALLIKAPAARPRAARAAGGAVPATATRDSAQAGGACIPASRGLRWPTLLWFAAVALVVVVAGLDPVPMPEYFPQQDKVAHLLGFAALYFSARFAFPHAPAARRVAACLALALLIEAGQGLFLAHRTASLADMLANTAGVALGAACAWLWQPRTPP